MEQHIQKQTQLILSAATGSVVGTLLHSLRLCFSETKPAGKSLTLLGMGFMFGKVMV